MNSIEIKKYFDLLYFHKNKIIIIQILSIFVIILYLYTKTDMYTGLAKIKIDKPDAPGVVQIETRATNNFQLVGMYYHTQKELIGSNSIIEDVIDELNLVEKVKEGRKTKKNDLFYTLFDDDRSAIDNSVLKNFLVEKIRKSLTITGGDKTEIIKIEYVSDDPELAYRIPNLVAKLYKESLLKSRTKSLEINSIWIDQRLNELEQKVYNSENKVKEFSENKKLVATEQQRSAIDSQLESLNYKLVEVQQNFSSSKATYERLLEIDNSPEKNYRSLGIVLNNENVQQIVKERVNILRKLEELNSRYGNKHPRIISLKSDLKSANKSLEEEIENVVKSVKLKYKSALEELKSIEESISSKKDEIINLQFSNYQLDKLERELRNSRLVYDSYLKELTKSKLASKYDISNIRIIDFAKYPLKPSGISKKIIFVIFNVFVFIVTVTVIILFNFFKIRISHPDDIESYLKIPLLGFSIKCNELSKQSSVRYLSDLITDMPEVNENFKSLRTSLILSTIDKRKKSFLITSSLPEEGKSTVAINLAIEFSRLGKTALIELDLRKPSFSDKLKLSSNDSDIVKFLNRDSEFITPHTIQGYHDLSIYPAYFGSVDAAELITNNRLDELFQKLNEEYNYIIIDSAPSLSVQDSLVLSRIVDNTVLCVKDRNTKISEAVKTINKIKENGNNLVGVVYTHVSKKSLEKTDYYHSVSDYYAARVSDI